MLSIFKKAPQIAQQIKDYVSVACSETDRTLRQEGCKKRKSVEFNINQQTALAKSQQTTYANKQLHFSQNTSVSQGNRTIFAQSGVAQSTSMSALPYNSSIINVVPGQTSLNQPTSKSNYQQIFTNGGQNQFPPQEIYQCQTQMMLKQSNLNMQNSYR